MKEAAKLFFANWGKKTWFLVNMYFTIVYLLWRIFFTIPFGYGFVSVFAGLTLLVVEVLGMVEAFIHYINMYNVENYPLPPAQEGEFPEVDVFVSTYSEPEDLLRKTLLGCKHMDYPDKSKVHIYLCDDGHREEMRALAQEMEVKYLCRDTHRGAKAGNLNHALENSSAPYIVTFDADMIPRSCFLRKTIPYFVEAERKNRGLPPEKQVKLGFVQTPQSFHDLDLFQFHLYSENRVPNEQDYFYKDIQVARTRTNSVIYGGSNTVISREALEAVGGFYTGAITEDFATGILMEKKGYVSLGLGEPLASGMNANSLQGLIQQRTRWARGVIATGRKMHIWTSKDLTFAQKMNYWASVWYWYAPVKRLSYIMSPILYATFGFMVFRCTLPQVLLFWLPMYVSSNISLRSLSQNIRNTKWTAIYETALFPFLLLPVLLESVGISLKQFKVTQKGHRESGKGGNVLYMVPFLLLIVLSVIGIGNCIRIMFDSGSFGPIVVLFWLVNNLFMLIMALFFVDGRVPYRRDERVRAALPATLRVGGKGYPCTTVDLSEGGAAVSLKDPIYLGQTEEIRLEVETKAYRVSLPVEPVYITQSAPPRWRYAFRIPDFQGQWESWLGILYDRAPTLPAEIRKNSGFYEDLSLNMEHRAKEPFREKRRNPRILLLAEVPGEEGSLPIHDFNYVAVTLDGTRRPGRITLFFPGVEPMAFDYRRETKSRGLYLMEAPEAYYNTREKCDAVTESVLSLAPKEPEKPAKKKKKGEKVFNEMDAAAPR